MAMYLVRMVFVKAVVPRIVKNCVFNYIIDFTKQLISCLKEIDDDCQSEAYDH